MALSLQPYQIPHKNNLIQILFQRFGALDRSRPGTGKTFTATAVALEMGFTNVIIICEPLAVPKWREMQIQFDLPIYDIITYNRLRSTKGHQPKHGLLQRVDELSDGGLNMTTFFPTTKLEQLCDQGTLFIVDEIQHIANQNDQSGAVKAITNHIVLSGGSSRYLFLSGTYATKEEQVITLLRLMGYIRNHRLYVFHKEANWMELLGAKELIDYCNDIDKERTTRILVREKITEKNVKTVCFDLYCDVLMNSIVSSMIKPNENEKIELFCKNLYVNMPSEEAASLSAAIVRLNNVARYNPTKDEINTQETDWGALAPAQRDIEMNKVNAAVRTVSSWLEENPNQKVVVYFNFTAPLESMKEQLSEYSPLIMNGKVAPEKRELYRQLFQQADTTYRLLLCNIRVAAENIDLDDKIGSFPRKVLIMPDYKIISLHQATYRFLRQDTRSSTSVYFFWGKCGRLESSIINALARKTSVMKRLHDDQVDQGIRFPGEYENEIEPDIPSLGIGGIWRPEHSTSTDPFKVTFETPHLKIDYLLNSLSIIC